VISDILNLVRWEWFKVRRRWMPWILLSILVLFSQLFVWGTYFLYQNQASTGGQVPYTTAADPNDPRGNVRFVDCSALRAGDVPDDLSPDLVPGLLQQCDQAAGVQGAQLAQLRASFTMPDSLSGAFNGIGGLALILLAILTASTIGMDYGIGTLRPILVRGTGRWPYLTSKFITLTLLTFGALVVLGIGTGISSVVANAMVSAEAAPAVTEVTWSDVGVSLVKTWFSILPYIALTGFVSILARSSAAGVAIGLAYYFTEGIAVAIFSALFEWFREVARFLLGQNIEAFTEAFTLGGGIGGIQVSMMHAFLVLVAYLVVFGVLSFWLFQRRDVTGGSGG
jgi:ABC-type transport system involved in multi-copper enzyme maturation permease subunit